eukprot:1614356-Alexandrium_andersonii.AAC.1
MAGYLYSSAGTGAAAGSGGNASQAVPGGLQRGFPGFWTPLFGPPSRPGGPPRTIWVPANQLLGGNDAAAAAAAAEGAG